MASSSPTEFKEEGYTVVLKNLPLDRLEEILVLVDESIREYLREKLAKSSEYTLVASISRTPSGVDLVIDLRVERCITLRERCVDVVNGALNYAKRRIEEYLENLGRTLSVNTT
ncbi:MAG: hypothetical protein LM555_01230 [Desulfurococcaceae archaeon]|nr:hypothetical protein [Desulfurococcaceae archaeon]